MKPIVRRIENSIEQRNRIGETWAFYIFGSVVVLVLLALIVGYAWTWPHQEARSTDKVGNSLTTVPPNRPKHATN